MMLLLPQQVASLTLCFLVFSRPDPDYRT